MTQGARRFSGAADRHKKQADDTTDLYSLIRTKHLSPQRIQVPSGGTSSSSPRQGGESGGFLRTSGGVMMGPIAFSPELVSINGTGHIDVSELSQKDSTYVLMTGAGSPDDLNWIDGARFRGQLLFLQGTASQVINIKHATTPGTNGNIVTPNGADVVLDGTVATNGVPVAILIFDVTVAGLGAWRAISSGSSGTMASNAIKAQVRVATTINGTLATAYENGDTVDGVVIATGQRILLKNQTTGSENGIYTVNASGAPTRATDFDTDAEILSGVIFAVLEGTVNADSLWMLTNNPVLGVDPMNFLRIGGGDVFLNVANVFTQPQYIKMPSAATPAVSADIIAAIGNQDTPRSISIYTFSSGSPTATPSTFAAKTARGTLAAPAVVQLDDLIGNYTSQGCYDVASTPLFKAGAGMLVTAMETFSATASGSKLGLRTTAKGSPSATIATYIDLTATSPTAGIFSPTTDLVTILGDTTHRWVGIYGLALYSGETNPATTGLVRNSNNTVGISWRNVANNGNCELAVLSNNFFDFTRPDNQQVTISVTGQHATDPDNIFTLTQFCGASTRQTTQSTPLNMIFQIAGSDRWFYDTNKIQTQVGIRPHADGTIDLGVDLTNRWRDVWASGFRFSAATSMILSTTGVTFDIDNGDSMIIRVNTVQKVNIIETLGTLTGNWVLDTGNLVVSLDVNASHLTLPNFGGNPAQVASAARLYSKENVAAGGIYGAWVRESNGSIYGPLGHGPLIEAGNSSILVTDTGTGQIDLKVDAAVKQDWRPTAINMYQNLSMNGKDVKDVNALIAADTTSSIQEGGANIGWVYNVVGGGTPDRHEFQVGSVPKAQIDNSGIASYGFIRSANTTEIGIYVTEAIGATIGTLGTMNIPLLSNTVTNPTNGTLNSVFGATDGNIGIHHNSTTDESRLYWRADSGAWYHVVGV